MWCLPGDNAISFVPYAVEIITFKVEKDSKRNSNVAGMKAVAVEENKSWCSEGLLSNIEILQTHLHSFLTQPSSWAGSVLSDWLLQTKNMQINPSFTFYILCFPMYVCEKMIEMLKLRPPKPTSQFTVSISGNRGKKSLLNPQFPCSRRTYLKTTF